MKDVLLAVFGLASAIVAVWQLATYLRSDPASVVSLIIAIIAAIIAIGFLGYFASERINKTEDIHITQ